MHGGGIASTDGGTALALLHDAVDATLHVDPAGLDDVELHDLVVRIQAERSRLAIAAADLLAEWDARGIWQGDGSRTAGHRLARETRSSVRSSKDEIRRARRIRHVPVARAAALDGRLSLDHVDLLAHANSPERRPLFERDEAMLVDHCAALSYPDGARVIRYWTVGADDHLAAPPVPADLPADDDHGSAAGDNDPAGSTGARVYLSRTFDDRFVLDGDLDPIDGTIVDDELDHLAERIRLADLSAGIDRTPAQRRAAALVEMARRSATAPADGRRPRPLFTVLVGDRSLEQLCELANGTVIPVPALVPHLRDACLESILFDGPSTVVSVSARRTFTGAVRRAVQVRDRHCQHPSQCDIPADRCDIDHIVPHARGGPTSQFNGRLECGPHNRNARLHDHGAIPRRERTIDRLDELRVRIRWRCRNDLVDSDDSSDRDDDRRGPGGARQTSS